MRLDNRLQTLSSEVPQIRFLIHCARTSSSKPSDRRAGKLDVFRLAEVSGLFDESEGSIGRQVELLERSGVLERLVVAQENGERVAGNCIEPSHQAGALRAVTLRLIGVPLNSHTLMSLQMPKSGTRAICAKPTASKNRRRNSSFKPTTW